MIESARIRRPRGQVLVITGLLLSALLMVTGLVLDAGFGLAQRRWAQNASDLAALAGARVLASTRGSGGAVGTDADVVASINKAVAENGGSPVTYGPPSGPRYVHENGALLAFVGSGSIPADAIGVTLTTGRSWDPFFASLFGASDWSTRADATARGGFRAGGPPPGNLLPIGVSEASYLNFPVCPAGVPTASCTVVNLTEGSLNIPGGFGWLKFGCGDETDDHGNPYGLGQNDDGCGNSKPFLEGEWGDLSADPPIQPKTYGCCTAVGLPGSGDLIGSLPGNKASLNDNTPGVAYYIDNEVIGFVPIWDYAGGTGSNGYYHIIGYAGFQITHIKGSKEIQGILRQVIVPGPVSSVGASFEGALLAIQLIK